MLMSVGESACDLPALVMVAIPLALGKALSIYRRLQAFTRSLLPRARAKPNHVLTYHAILFLHALRKQ